MNRYKSVQPGSNNKMNKFISAVLLSVVCYATFFNQNLAEGYKLNEQQVHQLFKRGSDNHHEPDKTMMHNHMSRKVFDRACAASKDTLDEIMACLHSNEHMIKAIKSDVAAECYKENFGVNFDPKETQKHKDLICNNRDKFESMTACTYRRTAQSLDSKEIEKLTEAMVDVGLCIINALDG